MIKDNIKFIVTFDFEGSNGSSMQGFESFKDDNSLKAWINDMEMMAEDDDGLWGWSMGEETGGISNLQIWDVRANKTYAHRYDLP